MKQLLFSFLLALSALSAQASRDTSYVPSAANFPNGNSCITVDYSKKLLKYCSFVMQYSSFKTTSLLFEKEGSWSIRTFQTKEDGPVSILVFTSKGQEMVISWSKLKTDKISSRANWMSHIPDYVWDEISKI